MAGGADIRAGRAFVELFLKNSLSRDFAKAAQQVQADIEKVSAAAMSIGTKLVAGGTAALAPLAASVKMFVDKGGELADMSARTGIAAGTLAELAHAASQTGAEMADLEAATKKMQNVIVDAANGSETAVAALKAVGMTAKDLEGLTPDQQLEKIGAALSSIKDPAMRTATAMEILGKSGTKLLPMLESVGELRAEARELGAMTDEEVAQADDLGDAWGRLMQGVSGVATKIASALTPTLMELIDAGTANVKAIIAWVSANKETVVMVAKIAAGVVAAGGAFMALAAGGMALTGIMSGIATVATMVGGAIGVITTVVGALFSPLGLVVAGLVAAGVALWKFTDAGKGIASAISGSLGSALAFVKQVAGGIIDALKVGDLERAWKIALVGMQLAGAIAFESLRSIVGDTVGDILSMLIKGDFSGAWTAAVSAMSLAWAKFSQGVVSVFTSVASTIASLWAKTVEGVANKILDLASEGGIVGATFSKLIGVDMGEEKARTEKLNRQARAKGLKTSDFDAMNQEGVKESVGATKEAIDAFLAQMDKAAADGVRAAQPDKPSTGKAESQSRIEELRRQLNELTSKKPDAKKAESAETPDDAAGAGLGLKPKDKKKIEAYVSTSAAASIAAGYLGMSNAKNEAAEATKKAAEKQQKQMDELLDKTDKHISVVQQYVAAMSHG